MMELIRYSWILHLFSHFNTFQVTKGLWKKYGDKRIIDTPITEMGFTGDIHFEITRMTSFLLQELPWEQQWRVCALCANS